MLSNFTLSAVVDTISHLERVRKAPSDRDRVFYLELAEMAISRALRGVPLDHPFRGAIEKKEREMIFARASLLS